MFDQAYFEGKKKGLETKFNKLKDETLQTIVTAVVKLIQEQSEFSTEIKDLDAQIAEAQPEEVAKEPQV